LLCGIIKGAGNSAPFLLYIQIKVLTAFMTVVIEGLQGRMEDLAAEESARFKRHE
jgi:hypothetical protein